MASRLDHLVVAGETLAAACGHVEAALGCALSPGGQHRAMATHNRLLALGDEAYLEAIAIDPVAQAPARARWFGLDAFRGSPRLVAWALRVDNLDAALADAPDGIGAPMALERGKYRWRITVPEDGQQPFDGVFPALIAWQGATPTAALPDAGATLISLTLTHPRAGALGWALSMLTSDDRIVVRAGPPGLSALIQTPTGDVTLA